MVDLLAGVESPPDSGSSHGTWVVIAAYNESASIGVVVQRLRQRLPCVVVVDDGSTDDTRQLALEAGAVVLRHRINLGQGAALQTGLDYTLGRGAHRIATFDADGQHRVRDLVAMLETLEEQRCDVVLGSRFLGSASDIPPLRRLVLRSAVLFTRATTGLAITDAHNGLRVLSRRAARIICLRNNRMAHASEILDQIKRARLDYREFPVQVRYTEYSLGKGQRTIDGFRILLDYFLTKIFP